MSESDDDTKDVPVTKSYPWFRATLFLVVFFGMILLFTSIPSRLMRAAREVLREYNNKNQSEAVESNSTNSPEEEVIRHPLEHTVSSGGDVRKLSNGIRYETELAFEKGRRASLERIDESSYSAQYKVKVILPEPAKTLADLESINPQLSQILPGLEGMLEEAKVSPFFYELYEKKAERVRRDAVKLNRLLSRHNTFDCETILSLTHSESGRKVLLLQADMDVVSDGSDGDRLAEMPEEIVGSTNYQPFTSYGWPKVTKTPNPMVAGWKKRIGNADREIANPSTSEDRRNWLINRKKYLQRGIEDMTRRSFLIAEYDPFIVLPVSVITSSGDEHAGRVGDYAVVIYGDRIFPAIVGDGGPKHKAGEASLRMARELNDRASPYSRPVSDLSVTYLIFSSSRGKKQAPNYQEWREHCEKLLGEIGGLGEGYELHHWEDLLPKSETE